MNQADINARLQQSDNQYLCFLLAGDTYAIDILSVREIRGWGPVRALPGMPAFVKGVLDLRGSIIPVIDLRLRFGQRQVDYTETTVIIVVRTNAGKGARTFGVVVDSVSDVLDAHDHQIMPAPRLGCAVDTRYLRGMVSLDDGMVVLLDIDKVFDSSEFEALAELGDCADDGEQP